MIGSSEVPEQVCRPEVVTCRGFSDQSLLENSAGAQRGYHRRRYGLTNMTKQGFGPPPDTLDKGRGYHGMAGYASVSADVATRGANSVNIHLTFEEALTLSQFVRAIPITLPPKGSTDTS